MDIFSSFQAKELLSSLFQGLGKKNLQFPQSYQSFSISLLSLFLFLSSSFPSKSKEIFSGLTHPGDFVSRKEAGTLVYTGKPFPAPNSNDSKSSLLNSDQHFMFPTFALLQTLENYFGEWKFSLLKIKAMILKHCTVFFHLIETNPFISKEIKSSLQLHQFLIHRFLSSLLFPQNNQHQSQQMLNHVFFQVYIFTPLSYLHFSSGCTKKLLLNCL